MKLLTHNLLSSHVPGLRPGGGFPLRIEVGARGGPRAPGTAGGTLPVPPPAVSAVPGTPTPGYEDDEEFLRRLHHVLLEVRTPKTPLGGGS
uniref:Uncharacterized protein n=1 Tax=Taeniopygia guttata TaxID=59729 RepID=A0A674H8P7_TAEGU